jgi:hypothetical protein
MAGGPTAAARWVRAPLTNEPVFSNSEWRVTLSAATNGQRFYRLQSP